jgi:hypothetical protein
MTWLTQNNPETTQAIIAWANQPARLNQEGNDHETLEKLCIVLQQNQNEHKETHLAGPTPQHQATTNQNLTPVKQIKGSKQRLFSPVNYDSSPSSLVSNENTQTNRKKRKVNTAIDSENPTEKTKRMRDF